MKNVHAAISGIGDAVQGMESMIGRALSRFGNRPPVGFPWRVLIVVSVVPVSVDSLYSAPMLKGDRTATALLLSFIAVAVLALWRPSLSAVMLATLYMVSCVFPSNISPLIIAPTAIGITCLSRERGIFGLASAIACSGASFIKVLSVQGDVTYGYGAGSGQLAAMSDMSSSTDLGGSYWETIIGTCAILLMCAFAGVAWAYRIDVAAAEREREILRYRLANVDLANQLHNSLCNDLVYIVFSSSHALEQKSGGEDVQYDLCEIGKTARIALEKTRTVISKLENMVMPEDDAVQGVVGDTTVGTPPEPVDIMLLIGEYDHRLQQLGFAGGTVVPPKLRLPSDCETGRVFYETVTEIYTNILKYADPEGGYVVSVCIDNDGLNISAANTVRNDPDRQLSHGTGLQRCKSAVESLGGRFSSSTQYGHWSCVVTIPYRNRKRDMNA